MSLSILAKEIKKRKKDKEKGETRKKQKSTKGVEEVGIADITETVENTEIATEVEPKKKYTEKQINLINSINDQDLKEQLGEDYDSELSKLENIIKLNKSKKQQLKLERYKQQKEKEIGIDTHIQIDEITLDNKSKLLTQLRVYIKELIKEWDTNASTGKDGEKDGEKDDEKDLVYETKVDLVPLLYKLRTDGLSDDMTISLTTICYHLQNKEYKKANESYMKLSIGNVAWPIGVVGVSHHSRSADSKITGEKNTANIMIDDKTRRWITGIKRLISYREGCKK